MDRKEKNQDFSDNVEQGLKAAMSDPNYWARRRSKWDEWGSPVGLSLGFAIFVVSLGLFIWLMHLSGLI